ncbi:MAG TPA: hypothetical protein VMC83_20115 [Streptosporangiaceae bacterium]|nr:hypothetical protein [Streptosporangiaceae bacterium]
MTRRSRARSGIQNHGNLHLPAARVVTAASLAHARGDIDFGNLDGSRGYSMGRAYSQSKLATCCSPMSCNAACPRPELG